MAEEKVHGPINQRTQTPKPRSRAELVAKRTRFWDWREDSALSRLLLQKIGVDSQRWAAHNLL